MGRNRGPSELCGPLATGFPLRGGEDRGEEMKGRRKVWVVSALVGLYITDKTSGSAVEVWG